MKYLKTVFLIHFLGYLTTNVAYAKYSENFTNVLSNYYRLERHIGCCLTLSKCRELCNYHKNCVSFFHKDQVEQCQLGSAISNITNLESSAGWNYYILSKGDCGDYLNLGEKTDGVYGIKTNGNMYDVWCDMTTDGGGWTVLQKRFDGSVDFFRGWNDYASGFGNLTGEFWLGNEVLHALTYKHKYKLRIDLEDHEGVWKYAEYSKFTISGNDTGYTMNIDSYSGTAGDALDYHNGRRFATKDNDFNACSTLYTGAWWYNHCHRSNLNGLYNSTAFGEGLNWYEWRGHYYSMKTSIMKIKRL